MGGGRDGELGFKAEEARMGQTLAATVQHWNPSNGTSRMGHAATAQWDAWKGTTRHSTGRRKR